MVFFQRFWVGRHARYPNERVEALKKWNFHNMAPFYVTKTQTLIFHTTPTQKLKKHKLRWEAKSLKYLGVNITKDLSELYNSNYEEVNNLIKTDIERWSTYPMDLTDRINAVKMNIQPRLLYLFQSLPVEVPQAQFTKWDKLISRFVWEGRRPRIRFTTPAT